VYRIIQNEQFENSILKHS